MIDIFKEPVVRNTEPRDVRFVVNARKSETSRFIYSDGDIVSLSTMMLANRISADIVKSSILFSGVPVVMSLGEISEEPKSKCILWGCQIRKKTDTQHEVLALTGAKSYELVGVKNGLMFDSRVLFPWFMSYKRRDPVHRVGMIPGFHDMKLVAISNDLQQNGITLVRPDAHIRTQLDLISSCDLFVTSSLSAYIMADALDVPAYMFHTGENYEQVSGDLGDYLGGLERKVPEILDFSKKIKITDMPNTEPANRGLVLDRIRKFIDVSPFNVRKEVYEEIEDYFNEI